LFDEQIILDQSWALDAIYSVFHRGKSYRKIQRLRGLFTRSDLAEWIWNEAGYREGEQKLFVSMMLSCGICFTYRREQPQRSIEAEYIAPDLLPERSEAMLDIEAKWETGERVEETVLEYTLLPPGLMRGIISRIGEIAGLAADYWRDGFNIYESRTKSRALVEQTIEEGWHGRIKIQTRGGQATNLLHRITELVQEEQARAGVSPADVTTTTELPRTDRDAMDAKEDGPPAEPALEFTQQPSRKTEYFVSYAWRDDTPEGQRREEIVDRLCEAAGARGIHIIRDKEAIGLGDSISKFMQRLGQGDRVFVILSERYLQSTNCMYELFEVWRNARLDDQEFLGRVRIFTLPGTKIWQPLDRAKCAAFWKNETKKIEELLQDQGHDILGNKDAQQYKRMKDFAHHIGDILAAVADILQPRDFEELERYGFGDVPVADDDEPNDG
jgi:internalin A